MFALAGITAPIVGWLVSGPIMALCGGLAVWGLWPLVADISPFSRRFVPLPEAARRVYEKTIDTLIGEMAANGNSPQEILNWYGVWIGEMRGVPIYGKRPPSQLLQEIPFSEIKRLQFKNGASELWETYSSGAKYTDLSLKRRDFRKNWKYLLTVND